MYIMMSEQNPRVRIDERLRRQPSPDWWWARWP